MIDRSGKQVIGPSMGRAPSDYSRRGVGAGSWHVSQALQAVLWGAAVIALGLWGAIELADWLLWGGL